VPVGSLSLLICHLCSRPLPPSVRLPGPFPVRSPLIRSDDDLMTGMHVRLFYGSTRPAAIPFPLSGSCKDVTHTSSTLVLAAAPHGTPLGRACFVLGYAPSHTSSHGVFHKLNARRNSHLPPTRFTLASQTCNPFPVLHLLRCTLTRSCIISIEIATSQDGNGLFFNRPPLCTTPLTLGHGSHDLGSASSVRCRFVRHRFRYSSAVPIAGASRIIPRVGGEFVFGKRLCNHGCVSRTHSTGR